ncbi:hypothetical protein [Cellulomonas sp.]|uniref:hypothetical protein n=1 Tax=Cellulomonas sp. TaxID=40001 RepID=UPI001B17EE74|nr:hypothetical protein [Cellulomonas sp.]MBO9554928.1 hypothetical protein [Cellulomonas sp.]
MTRKFGTHGDLVEKFLDEVRERSDGWAEVAARADSPQQRPAVKALTQVHWPAALLSAVDAAALQAYGSLGLTRGDFDDPFALGTVKVAISAGAKAIAVQDELAPEHLEALLRPFADEGFQSALATLAP